MPRAGSFLINFYQFPSSLFDLKTLSRISRGCPCISHDIVFMECYISIPYHFLYQFHLNVSGSGSTDVDRIDLARRRQVGGRGRARRSGPGLGIGGEPSGSFMEFP